jgi:hypothetical protein
MFGGRRWASSSRALTRQSRGGPDANTICHGWMLEFDGACWAKARASSTSARGTGFLGKHIRVEWRSLIICSRSNVVLLLRPTFHLCRPLKGLARRPSLVHGRQLCLVPWPAGRRPATVLEANMHHRPGQMQGRGRSTSSMPATWRGSPRAARRGHPAREHPCRWAPPAPGGRPRLPSHARQLHRARSSTAHRLLEGGRRGHRDGGVSKGLSC